MIKQTFKLGSINVLICDRDEKTSLVSVPSGMDQMVSDEKTSSSYAMAQLHIMGDEHEVSYSRGLTMLGSAFGMKLTEVRSANGSVTIEQENERGLHTING